MTSEAETYSNNLKILHFMNSAPVKTIGVVPHDLHYHDNIKCIDEVISKIKSTYHPKLGIYRFQFLITSERCIVTINLSKRTKTIADVTGNGIGSMNKCVLKFIDWYEKNKKCRRYREPFTY